MTALYSSMLVRLNEEQGGGLLPLMAGEDQLPVDFMLLNDARFIMAIWLTFISIKTMNFIHPSTSASVAFIFDECCTRLE